MEPNFRQTVHTSWTYCAKFIPALLRIPFGRPVICTSSWIRTNTKPGIHHIKLGACYQLHHRSNQKITECFLALEALCIKDSCSYTGRFPYYKPNIVHNTLYSRLQINKDKDSAFYVSRTTRYYLNIPIPFPLTSLTLYSIKKPLRIGSIYCFVNVCFQQ